MRNLKKLLALVLVAALVFSLALSGFAKTIADYDDAAAAAATLAEYKELEDTYADAVQLMIDLGVVVGTGGNNVDLGRLLYRSEFTVMLYKALNGGVAIETNEPSYALTATPFFTDVPKGNWFFPYANWAGINGISAGVGNGKFGPNDVLTLDQALLLVMKSLGLDTAKEVGFTFSNAQVTGLAYQLKLLGDLYPQNDKGQINRATACLLFQYMIFSEQIRYSLITGERYLTGDDEYLWISGGNPSYTLAEKKFGLVMGTFTIISDGKWFALPSIKNVAAAGQVTNAALGSGKAVVQRPVAWDAATGDVTSWQTFIVSADDTKAYGFTLEDVGRKVKMVFRKPSNTLRDSIPKLYGNVSYVDDVAELTDMTTSLEKDVAAVSGIDMSAPNYDAFFINYANNNSNVSSNNIVTYERSLRRDDWGASYRWNSYSASFTNAGTGTTFDWGSSAYESAYASAKTAFITDATRDGSDPLRFYANKSQTTADFADPTKWNDYTKTDFAIWLAAKKASYLSTDTSSAAVYYRGLNNIDFKVKSFSYKNGQWGHADIRVIYEGDEIKFVFVNDYSYGQFDKVDSGNLVAKNSFRTVTYGEAAASAATYIHGKATSNIMNFGSADDWKKDDYFVYCNIGSTGNYIIHKAPDKNSGVVTKITGGQDTITVGGTDYKVTSMRLLMWEVSYRWQDYNGAYGNFDLGWAGVDVTLHLWRGKVMNVTGRITSNTEYCVVMKSQLIDDVRPLTFGVTAQVQVILQDGTIGTYNLAGIKLSDGYGAKLVTNKATPTNGEYGENATSGGVAIKLRTSSGIFSTVNTEIDDHLFEVYSINGNNITLKVPGTGATASTTISAVTNGFVTTRFYQPTASYDFGLALNGKYITENTVTFIKVGSGASTTYRAFVGQYVPGFSVLASGASEAVLGDKDLVPTANGAYATASFIDANGGTFTTDLAWCVALQIRDRYYADGKWWDELVALTNEGIKTLKTNGAFLFSDKQVQRGDMFTYRGSQNAVEDVTIANAYYTITGFTPLGANGILTSDAGNNQGAMANNFSYATNAEFYYVDGLSNSAWEGPINAEAAKGKFDNRGKTNGVDNGLYLLVTKQDENSKLITQAVILRHTTKPSSPLAGINLNVRDLNGGYGVYTGQGFMQVTGTGSFTGNEAQLAGLFKITDGTNTVTPTVLKMTANDIVLYFNPIINSINAKLVVTPSAYLTEAQINGITNIGPRAAKYIDVPVTTGQTSIIVNSTEAFSGTVPNNDNKSICIIDGTGPIIPHPSSITYSNANKTMTVGVTAIASGTTSVRVYISGSVMPVDGGDNGDAGKVKLTAAVFTPGAAPGQQDIVFDLSGGTTTALANRLTVVLNNGGEFAASLTAGMFTLDGGINVTAVQRSNATTAVLTLDALTAGTEELTIDSTAIDDGEIIDENDVNVTGSYVSPFELLAGGTLTKTTMMTAQNAGDFYYTGNTLTVLTNNTPYVATIDPASAEGLFLAALVQDDTFTLDGSAMIEAITFADSTTFALNEAILADEVTITDGGTSSTIELTGTATEVVLVGDTASVYDLSGLEADEVATSDDFVATITIGADITDFVIAGDIAALATIEGATTVTFDGTDHTVAEMDVEGAATITVAGSTNEVTQMDVTVAGATINANVAGAIVTLNIEDDANVNIGNAAGGIVNLNVSGGTTTLASTNSNATIAGGTGIVITNGAEVELASSANDIEIDVLTVTEGTFDITGVGAGDITVTAVTVVEGSADLSLAAARVASAANTSVGVDGHLKFLADNTSSNATEFTLTGFDSANANWTVAAGSPNISSGTVTCSPDHQSGETTGTSATISVVAQDLQIGSMTYTKDGAETFTITTADPASGAVANTFVVDIQVLP